MSAVWDWERQWENVPGASNDPEGCCAAEYRTERVLAEVGEKLHEIARSSLRCPDCGAAWPGFTAHEPCPGCGLTFDDVDAAARLARTYIDAVERRRNT